MKEWERRVLRQSGAPERVAEIEDELRLAAGLTALREQAGLSQRELAARLDISQPRVAAIERSKNVTLGLLEQYVRALGGSLEITVRAGGKRTNLVSSPARRVAASGKTAAMAPRRKVASAAAASKGADAKATAQTTRKRAAERPVNAAKTGPKTRAGA